MLAITGHAYHDLIDTFSHQDVDLDKVFMDVAVYSSATLLASRPLLDRHQDVVRNLQGGAHASDVTARAYRLRLALIALTVPTVKVREMGLAGPLRISHLALRVYQPCRLRFRVIRGAVEPWLRLT